VRLHPQAIAQHGATGERARRIDSDDANGFALAAEPGGEAIDKGALARAWRSRVDV
jgi:hypothetical protein